MPLSGSCIFFSAPSLDFPTLVSNSNYADKYIHYEYVDAYERNEPRLVRIDMQLGGGIACPVALLLALVEAFLPHRLSLSVCLSVCPRPRESSTKRITYV